MQKLKAKIEPKLLEKLTSLADIEAVSMVNGIEFSGISIGPTDVSVTLTRQTTANNITAYGNNTSLPVTVFVLRVPISNITQTMSMVQSARNLAGEVNNMATGGGATTDLGLALASSPTTQGTVLRVLSTLKNIQIGIGAFVHPNWNSPQTISLGLLGFPRINTSNNSGGEPADVIRVVIFPYRGATNMATVPLQ